MNGTSGISVAQAIAGEVEGLDDRDEGIAAFGGSKIICRIQVSTTTTFRTSVPTNIISSWPGMICIHLTHEVFTTFCIRPIDTHGR